MGFFRGKDQPPAKKREPKPPQLDLSALTVQLPPDKQKEIEALLIPQFYETFVDDEQATWSIVATALQQETASGTPILWVKSKADNFSSPDSVFVWATIQEGAGVTVEATYSPEGQLFSMLCSKPGCVKGLPNPVSWV
jgi:hypothetical protein